MKTTATLTVTKWNETAYRERTEGKKLTRCDILFQAQGGFTGHVLVEWLMAYTESHPDQPHDSKSTYVGLMTFEGTFESKQGSVVMESHGTFTNGVAHCTLRAIPDSGTGELRGFTGSGILRATHDHMLCEMDYTL